MTKKEVEDQRDKLAEQRDLALKYQKEAELERLRLQEQAQSMKRRLSRMRTILEQVVNEMREML